MDHRPDTPLLDRVQRPADLKQFSDSELTELASELRSETVSAVSVTGGHLGAGLGVVELTVALHAVFDTPKDKVIWDVGHQCYPHKIITGRRDRIRTLRMKDGLSGFTKRSESVYDPFGAARSAAAPAFWAGQTTYHRRELSLRSPYIPRQRAAALSGGASACASRGGQHRSVVASL